MKRTEQESLQSYYHEAGSWAHDRAGALRASRRVAWIVAGLAVVVAIFEACALIFLAPLKTVVPYTLMVDRQTGYVQALKPIDADMIAPDAALTQSFLVQYVIARESFDVDELQSDYHKVFLWSNGTARADYVAGVQISNPQSPLAKLPRKTVIETRVKSVSALGNSTSLVRFETQRHDAGAQAAPAQSWVAVVQYRFSTQAQSADDRFINPLGFQVIRYHRDMETLPPSGTDTTTTAAPTPPLARPVTSPSGKLAGSPGHLSVESVQ